MKKTSAILLSVAMTLSLCGSVFADPDSEITEDFDPVSGSWFLDQVYYRFDDEGVILRDPEENQSKYGSGGFVFTFDEDGTAHEMIINNMESTDISAEWKSVSPDVYRYTDEDGLEMEFHYDADEDRLHRYELSDDRGEDSPEQDYVYVRAVSGSWQLDQVVQVTEENNAVEADKAQVILPKEENQSLYAEEGSIYTFYADGGGLETIQDGPDTAEKSFSWKTEGPDEYVMVEDEEIPEMVFFYLREDDTMYRDVVTEDSEALYPHLRFVYKRTILPEDQEDQMYLPQVEMPETPQIEIPVYSEPPAEEPWPEEPLAEDSQIFDIGADEPILMPEL
ncbi:MAG: hypothetical protein IJ123_07845 [Blautia sp.]|nr:hypothetical protein [Blautia sp.]